VARRRVTKNESCRRSAGEAQEFEPATMAAAPALAACYDPVVAEDGPHSTVRFEPTALLVFQVVPRGRATNVPFIAVLSGLERTTVDNPEAASTCVVPHPRR
jgi:hypothetical protein